MNPMWIVLGLGAAVWIPTYLFLWWADKEEERMEEEEKSIFNKEVGSK